MIGFLSLGLGISDGIAKNPHYFLLLLGAIPGFFIATHAMYRIMKD